MKTIAFFSVKGGVGKSLAAANLAIMLSRMNKHCVLVDCDFEGPSLPAKFPRLGRDPQQNGGFVEYFLSGTKAWGSCYDFTDGKLTPANASSIDGPEPLGHASLEEVARSLWAINAPEEFEPVGIRESLAAFTYRLKGDSTGGAGTVHFLRAGEDIGEEYNSIIQSPTWHRLFAFLNYQNNGVVGAEYAAKCSIYFQSIKNEFIKLKPAPEYCIVDLRSGAFEYADTIVSQWLGEGDDLVYCFSYNPEGVGYLVHSIPGFNKQTVNDRLPYNVIPVLARVPIDAEVRNNPRIHAVLRDLQMPRGTRIFPLHTDRQLEGFEEVRLWAAQKKDVENTRLAHDYVNLFSKLISTKEKPWSHLEICKAIGLPPNLQQVERIFRLEVSTGALINPNDDSRNVSFKVDTFQRLLHGLESTLVQSVSGKKNEKTGHSWFSSSLDNAGVACGEAFGEKLKEKWDEMDYYGNRTRIGIEERLQKWCEFDSDVGFGRFEVVSGTLILDPNFRDCVIRLHESFLSPATDTFNKLKDDPDHRFQNFLRGYVQGVMSQILPVEIKVTYSKIAPRNVKYQEVQTSHRSQDAWLIIKRISK